MKFKKIYVATPAGGVTGGVELAHQLVDYLRRKGQEAYTVYCDWDRISDNQTITEAYSNYNIKTSNVIEDDSKNILILPEIYFDLILQYKNIQIGCWWMSVDNRYYRIKTFEKIIRIKGLKEKMIFIYELLFHKPHKYRNSTSLLKKESRRIVHFYQSKYAQNHLYNMGYYKILPLSDYINVNYLTNSPDNKKDIVLYNPAKGWRFTRKIIKLLPDVDFIPLKGLTREEMKVLLGQAKLYIDFGGFPGKDRIPREAVISGCCLITGNLGASRFYEDVPITEKYKFEVKNRNLPMICSTIKYILNNYESCTLQYEEYRTMIKREQNDFYEEIERALLS